MTHPMPDQNTDQPAKRMTTAEVAAFAQGLDGRLDDLSEVVTDLSTQLRDRATAHAELRDDLMGKLSGVRPGDAPTRDQMDARIHEALAPLHEEVHELRGRATQAVDTPDSPKLAAILARLEDAERKLAPLDADGLTAKVAAELHPTLSALRTRLDELDTGDPVSHTLAEDALADQIQAAVERALTDISTTSDTNTARADQLVREFENLRAYVEDVEARRDPDYPNRAAASGDTNGLGAARKVLELMRMVTHIGKERQADMGTGGKFKFRGIDEAMDAVGHAMREVGVILSTEVLKDETSTVPVTKKGDGRNGPYESTILWTTTKTTMRYTFVDPEDGSTHAIEMVGEGRDASDKSTSKAGSMAFKYALLQALCIPVNGLDDSDAAPPQVMENERSTRPAQVQQQERPQQQPDMPDHRPQRTEQQKAQRAGQALTAIRNVYRVQGGPQAQYAKLVQIMGQVKQEGLLDFALDGATLNQHGEAARRTLQAPGPGEDASDGSPDAAAPEPPAHYGDHDGSNFGESGGY